MAPTPYFATRMLPYGAASIGAAAELVRRGLPVAIATETVYGLAGDATNAEAIARIYAAKGRPSFNPLIVHVLSLEMAERLGRFSDDARALARQYWPGPLTLIVPARADNGVADLATAGLSTIAIRVPAHSAMRSLLAACGRPLAAPSANLSGSISPTQAAHVRRTLEGRIPLIVDAGPTMDGIESTVIAVDETGRRLLRPGPLQIESAPSIGGTIESPGQLASHYAPTKPLRLNAVSAEADEYMIGFGSRAGDVNLSDSGDLIEAAARLFAALHLADASGRHAIAIAPIPESGIGIAINDRLRRAATRD